MLELADLRWNSSVKKSMPRENPGEWKEIQAPKYDRYPGQIQGSEGVGDIVNSLKVVNQNTGLLCRWEQLHGRMQDEFSWGSLIFSTAISRGNKDFKSYKSTIFLYPKITELLLSN